MNSLRDEIRFLFSGQGMPYEKVCLMVAAVVCIVLGTMPVSYTHLTLPTN